MPKWSYWPYAFEGCGLEEDKEELFKYKHTDYYWRSVGSLVCNDGQLKYVQLFALVKCVLSL